MKKLLLFVLCLSCWTQSFGQTNYNLTQEQEEEAWEILIQQFFPKGMEDFSHPERFYDDISYHIVNPTKNDSLALQMLIDQIDPLIPQTVFYSKTKEEANFIIEINTLNDSLKNLGNFRYYQKDFEIGNKSGYSNNEIIFQHLSLEAQNRPKAIRTWALIGLIRADLSRSRRRPQSQYSSQSILIYPHINQQILDDNSYYKITDLDKFLLKKLYSKDLDEQVRNFILGSYGYWAWLNFLFSPDVLQTLKLLVFVFLVILIASLLYWPITQFRFKYKLLNYVFLSLILANITGSLFLLYSYFKILRYQGPPSRDAYENISFEYFFTIMSTISVFAVLFSLLLFTLDQFILTQSRTLFSRFSVRTANFITSILVAGLSILVVTQDFSSKSISIILFGGIGLLTFGVARSVFFYFKEKNENLILEKDLQLSYLGASKAEAEVASLHARINPHFLYNSLNSIAGLAHIDADKTEKMALSLSDLFRHNLNRKNQPFCTIKEEIEACKAYMEIEQIRFGNKLEFSTEIDESVYEYLIPRNIIQPLLENAIKHGVSQLNTTGKIKLQIIETGGNIQISVYDNGPAFQEGGISGYGLQSIFDILNLTYKNKAELSRENTPEKRVWISISKNELNKAAQ